MGWVGCGYLTTGAAVSRVLCVLSVCCWVGSVDADTLLDLTSMVWVGLGWVGVGLGRVGFSGGGV